MKLIALRELRGVKPGEIFEVGDNIEAGLLCGMLKAVRYRGPGKVPPPPAHLLERL